VNATAVALSKSSGHTILAFDYGEKYVGVAVGDTETRLASPLGMFSAGGAAQRLAEIDTLVREWHPDRILVGLPLTMDGAEHVMTRRARRFARQLEARFRLPVEFADERLSSASAESTLRESGRGGRRHKHEAHGLAAQIILQGYLDESARR
jgi:putative holliday junction resolvase